MMNILTRLFGEHSSQNYSSIISSVQSEKWFWIKAVLHFVLDFYTVSWSSIFLFGMILINCVSKQDMANFPYDESLSLSV